MSDRDEADNCVSVAESGLESDNKIPFETCSSDISSPEGKGFRGFPKPCVALPRLDISPFFKPKPPPILEEVSESANKPEIITLKSILKKPSYDKFNAKCSVNIIRTDLEKMKDLISKTPDLYSNQAVGSPSMSLKCKICNKDYSSVKKLLNHKKNKHMIIKAKSDKRVSFSDKVIVHELKEYHKCRKCPKIFEDYRSLKAHMKVQHKKRKCYICNYCSKKFVDRMFFKVHIKLHCESCGQLFTSKMKCMLHKRSVCKILKLHQCKVCEISFFKLMDLKDHSYEHINTCYVCDICKDQCPTKCGIAHHIYFLHSKRNKKKNPSLYITRKLCTESLYLCKFCEESSVDKDLIEQHVQLLPDLNNRVMTGYKDYYFCDQCLKKFSTEKDMLQHKWSHFLKTSDNSQERPNTTATNKNGVIKTIYNINEKIPDIFLPKIVLDKIKMNEKDSTDKVEIVDIQNVDIEQENVNIEQENVDIEQGNVEKVIVDIDIEQGNVKKAIVDPKSKKTIISRHQCPNCSKYYSSNYSLNRHIETQHSDFENLQCKVCEETFVWPSLLQSHKCIRTNLQCNVCEETFVWPSLLQSHKCIRTHIPEMPFDDARPEIHFDNIHQINLQNNMNMTNGDAIEMSNGFDDLNIAENDDYMNSVDFEIPAPIVELTEYENIYRHVPNTPELQEVPLNQGVNKVNTLQSLGYKLVMQEVPIEF